MSVLTTYDAMFAEIALKFCNKAGIMGNYQVMYIYNSEELKIESPKSLAELHLRDRSIIEVIMTNTVLGA